MEISAITGGSGVVAISLPVAITSTSNYRAVGCIICGNVTYTADNIMLQAQSGEAYARIVGNVSASGIANLGFSDVAANAIFRGSITYQI